MTAVVGEATTSRWEDCQLPGHTGTAKVIFAESCQLSFCVIDDDHHNVKLTAAQALALGQFIARCLSASP